MRPPVQVSVTASVTLTPAEIDQIPDHPAVFLLWASQGNPYLARTSALKRRLNRLFSSQGRLSRLLNLNGVVDRIEYWPTGSQIEAALVHLELAQLHFPDDWPRITRLRPPSFLRLTTHNQFPRTMITTRLGRGAFYGPFASRAAAETFQTGLLDLFQLRRCEENLHPAPEHAGCIYGEMNRCLRPCQQVVSIDEYSGEAARVAQFLETRGASLKELAEQSRDRASLNMQFEEAARLHQRVERIAEVQSSSGDLARALPSLAGIAVTPSAVADAVDLWFLLGGVWRDPHRLSLSEDSGAGRSLDHRLHEIVEQMKTQTQREPARAPVMEHLSILTRWHHATWRDGEWIEIDWPAKIPYRKLVNAIGRVGRPTQDKAGRPAQT